MPYYPLSAADENIKTLLMKPFMVEKLDAPFNQVYSRAYVSCSVRKGMTVRRFIQFRGKLSNVESDMADRIPVKTTYARYLMNCHLWKTEGRLLTDEEEVDHVNGNALDDRLDNFEIVSREENIRRRDHMKYASWGVTPAFIDTLRMHLRSGENRRYIANEMGIPMGYLRYLILNYIPELNAEIGVERDIDDIIKRRKEGESCRSIADTYGVDGATIQRFVTKYCPELSGAAFRQDRTAYIIEQAKAGVHYNEIAKVLGCVPTNVWYYIKQHLPEIAKRDYYDKADKRHVDVAERNARIIDMIAPFINKGVVYREFNSGKWDLPNGKALQCIVSRYDKDNKVKPLDRNRPRSECPTVEEVMEKHPELRGTLPLKQ